MGRTFASLKFYNYRVWFFAALIANTGTWMQRIAQNWLVINDLTDNSASAVGLITALQFVPVIFVMPVAGSLADRFDKRKIVFVTQLGQMLSAFGLAALILTGTANLGNVCLFAFILGIVAAFDSPPRLTFISELVPPRSLPNAIGLNSMSFNIARLIGPALAGALIAAVGTGWVFVINGAMFLATLVALLLMRPKEFHPAPQSEQKEGTVEGIVHGLKYLRRRSDLMLIFVVVGIASCTAMNNNLTTAAMSTSVFDKGAGEFGVVGSVLAIGSLSGALHGARRTAQPRVRSVVGAGCGLAIAMAINAIAPSFWLYTVTLIPVGYFMIVMLTAANTAVQMSTAPDMRGRVVSLYQTVVQGVVPVGALLTGWISDGFGARWGVGMGAIGCAVAVVGALIWGRHKWDVEIHYRIREPLHLEILGPLEHEQEQAEEEAATTASAPAEEAAPAEKAGPELGRERAASQQAEHAAEKASKKKTVETPENMDNVNGMGITEESAAAGTCDAGNAGEDAARRSRKTEGEIDE
ncbi:MFS transporter [Actinobaculum suis]|uniref:MFS transporter n=1 Tax=Actinobaculum suis TaxID=1657 RepID=UPI0009E3113D|nr:MFS transporter [Actinobaculum suis]